MLIRLMLHYRRYTEHHTHDDYHDHQTQRRLATASDRHADQASDNSGDEDRNERHRDPSIRCEV
jgi:hypothetical protein